MENQDLQQSLLETNARAQNITKLHLHKNSHDKWTSGCLKKYY